MAAGFAATRDGIDTMLRDRGLRQTPPELTAESLLRGAHASAVLAGSSSTLDECRVGAGDATAQAALRVSVELLALVPVFSRTPLQALARLHTLAAAGSVTDDEIGRPRDPASAARLREVATLVGGSLPALLRAAHPFLGQPGSQHPSVGSRQSPRPTPRPARTERSP